MGKEGVNTHLLGEHLVELPLDLAETISVKTSRGLGAEGPFKTLVIYRGESSSGGVWLRLMLRFN